MLRNQPKTPRRAVDFAISRTSLDREEAYILLSIIDELRVGPRRGRSWQPG